MKIPKKEIEMLADYCEMDLMNGVQMNHEWEAVYKKVRAWIEAVEHHEHPTNFWFFLRAFLEGVGIGYIIIVAINIISR